MALAAGLPQPIIQRAQQMSENFEHKCTQAMGHKSVATANVLARAYTAAVQEAWGVRAASGGVVADGQVCSCFFLFSHVRVLLQS